MWLQTKFALEKASIVLILAKRVCSVSLCQVRLDQQLVAAFTKGVGPEPCESSLSRGAVSAELDHVSPERLQCVESQLPQPVSFDQHPLVVPVGKKLALKKLQVEVLFLDLGRVQQLGRDCDLRTQVDGYGAAQTQMRAGRINHLGTPTGVLQTPKRRAQTRLPASVAATAPKP